MQFMTFPIQTIPANVQLTPSLSSPSQLMCSSSHPFNPIPAVQFILSLPSLAQLMCSPFHPCSILPNSINKIHHISALVHSIYIQLILCLHILSHLRLILTLSITASPSHPCIIQTTKCPPSYFCTTVHGNC